MADTEVGKPQPLEEWFLNLLACPACPQRSPVRLLDDKSALVCEVCHRSYPVRDGIPILLIDEATILEPATASPESV